MKKLLTSFVLILGLAASTVVFAQQPPRGEGNAPQADREGRGKGFGMKRGRGFGGRGHGRRIFAQLDLTDAQKEQLRTLREAQRQRNQPQREEMRGIFAAAQQSGQMTEQQRERLRQLHEEMRASNEAARAGMLNILTPEQRAKLEQLRQEREQRREQFRQRREQLRQQRQTNNQT